jgi:hypothetical protein
MIPGALSNAKRSRRKSEPWHSRHPPGQAQQNLAQYLNQDLIHKFSDELFHAVALRLDLRLKPGVKTIYSRAL